MLSQLVAYRQKCDNHDGFVFSHSILSLNVSDQSRHQRTKPRCDDYAEDHLKNKDSASLSLM